MAEKYHGYLYAEPRFKPRTFQIRGKDADHLTVPFFVSLCCDAIASCHFKTASKFSSLLFIITFIQFFNYTWKSQKPSVKIYVHQVSDKKNEPTWEILLKYFYCWCAVNFISYFRRFRKNGEKRLLASSCLSVRPHEITRLPPEEVSWNLIL